MTKGKRKKRTWIIAGVVCTIVVALVVAAIVLLTNGEEENKKPTEEGPALSLEDLLHGKVIPNPFNATWVSGNYSDICYINYETNK
jgi:flagellar basal body-associated protein FliL